jgi:hypothetical protein
MLERSPINPIAYHEAGYIVAAKSVGLQLQKYRRDTLRCAFADVVVQDDDDGSEDFCERAALIMLIGGAALNRFAPTASSNDDVQARELLYHRMWRRQEGPFPRSMWNEFNILLARLQDKAAAFVAANADEIARIAANLPLNR